jgi:hypothetical protein
MGENDVYNVQFANDTHTWTKLGYINNLLACQDNLFKNHLL